MWRIKRKTGSFVLREEKISNSDKKNLPKIKKRVLGIRSGTLTNIWSGKVSENINAFVGAATGGNYKRIKYFSNFQGDDGLKFAGSGKGWSKEEAEISAIGEFFERYASAFVKKDEKIKVATAKELGKEEIIEANQYFTDKQFQEENFFFKKIKPDTKISWVKMKNLISGKNEWVPAIFCFFPFWGIKNDRLALPTSTNGIAAHKNINLATISAILEILERDLFTNAWLSGTSFQLSEIPDDERWNDFFKNFTGEIFCIFPENDFNIPFCVLSLKFPAIKGKSLIVSGSACAFSKKEAFSSALLEAFQGKKYLELEKEKDFHDKNFQDVQSFTDHCRFYTERNGFFSQIPLYENLATNSSHLLKKEFKEKIVLKSSNEKEQLEFLIDIFKKKKYPLYFYDLTSRDSKEVGISVVRVFAPHLSSLYGDERFRYLGQKRIWKKDIFPTKIKVNSFGNYNQLPHFMG